HKFWRNRRLRPSGHACPKHIANGRRLATSAVIVKEWPRCGRAKGQEPSFAMILDQRASYVVCHLRAAAEVVGAEIQQQRHIPGIKFSTINKVGPGELADFGAAVRQPESPIIIQSRKIPG